MGKKKTDDRQLFLLGQTLSQLAVKDPKKLFELLCEDPPPAQVEGEGKAEKWKPRSRAKIVVEAASKDCAETSRAGVRCRARQDHEHDVA